MFTWVCLCLCKFLYFLWEGERSLAEEEEAENIRRSAVFMIMVVHGQGLRSWLVMVIV